MPFVITKSLRYRFAFSIVLIAVLSMIFAGIYHYYNMSSILTENANTYLMQYVKQINSTLESQFEIIDNTAIHFIANPSIRSILADDGQDGSLYIQAQKKIQMDAQMKYLLLFNYAWDRKLLNSVFIFRDRQTYYYILRHAMSFNIIENNSRVFDKLQGLSGEKNIVPPSPDDKTIYFAFNINDLNTQKLLGRLVLSIEEGALIKLGGGTQEYKGTLIVTFDSNGVIFSHNDKSMVGEKVSSNIFNIKDSKSIVEINADGVAYLAAANRISKYGLISVVAVPKKEVFANLTESINNFFIIMLVIILLFILISIFVSSRVTRPIKDLMKTISQVRNGNFDVKMPEYKYIELNRLSHVFNNMMDEIHYLINQVYEKQLLLKEAELKSLQAQVNPHFLFNVLETISWQARMTGSDTIYEMVTSLGQLMRASIYLNDREKITVREELQYVRFYLYLQKIRFEDRLNADINIADEAILEFYLPKLCIQPIVENAVVHGLENKRGRGSLVINIKMKGDSVYFEITDNGVGFDVSSIDLDAVDAVKLRRHGRAHIGLYNTNKRIKLLYGERYGLTIRSKENVGTTVIVRIPADEGEDNGVQHNDC